MNTTDGPKLIVEELRKRDALALAELIFDIYTRLKRAGKLDDERTESITRRA